MRSLRASGTILTIPLLLAFATLSTSPTHAQSAPSVAADYKVPTITIPYATHKPTIDGVINDTEWQNAISVTGLQTTNHSISPRQTRFWLTWDEDTLYIAMRSPLRPGERLIQALRETDRDLNNAVFDDSYEIWLDVGTNSPDGQPAFFQYLGNFAGARFDVMQEPAAGNSRPSWTAGWQPRNRLTRVTPDGQSWEMEMAIPRVSVYRSRPFADGFAFSALLTRNYKRPWDQVSISGSGSFSVRETYARFVLAKEAPAVHLLGVADPQAKTFGLALAASAGSETGTTPKTLHWRFDSDGGVHESGDLTVAPNLPTAALPARLGLDRPGDGNYRIRVTEGGETGRTLLDWSAKRQWGDLSALTETLHDTGDRVELTLGYNPARDYLRITGDFIGYDARGDIKRYHADVRDAQGKTLASRDLHLDSLAYVRDVLPLPNLPAGTYTARLTAFDSAGQTLFTRESPFEKKDPAASFPWWNTSLGNIERVIAPWTPVRWEPTEKRIGVWGRQMTLGAAGLPGRITAQGRDLLADGGAYLEATLTDGKRVRASGGNLRVISSAEHRLVATVSSGLGDDLSAEGKVTAEFDGMYRVDLTLTPLTTARIDALTLVVPLRAEISDYLHACGEGIRYGFDDRFLPQGKTGVLWDSRRVDGQPMRSGSFIPYLWVGDPNGGLCWFADSDQGWAPSNTTPAIEIRRRNEKDGAEIVFHFISTPTTLSEARTITFAFQATPVRPLQPGWRMDTWWTNDSFKDWAQVESQGHAGNMGLIFSSIPFPLDPAKSRQMVDDRHKQFNSVIFGQDKYHANAVPYFEHINMGEKFVPALTYFGDEWRTRVSRGLAYGKTLQDFMIWNLAGWVKSAGIDGFYVDNVFPIADDNFEAGRGYRLPDGSVQPTYQMFDTRRYFLRMRAAFAEQGKSGKIVLHMTNHLIAPWMGAADIALDGEHHVIYPEMGKDFTDFWSQERLRMDHPAQWGVPVNFLQEYQGDWKADALKTAMRAYTGPLLLNDTLASANANGQNQAAWLARDRFGIEADDVRFHYYADPNSGLSSPTSGVLVSGWTRPGKLLIVVVNSGDTATNASVKIEARKLGLPAPSQWRIRDAETLAPLAGDGKGGLTIPIPRHDYRQIRIESGG